jgi:hypothetical protein
MTPKETAKELVKKFMPFVVGTTGSSNEMENAKYCATISVYAIINASPTNPLTSPYIMLHSEMVDEALAFWSEVKTEIEKL